MCGADVDMKDCSARLSGFEKANSRKPPKRLYVSIMLKDSPTGAVAFATVSPGGRAPPILCDASIASRKS